MLPDGCGWSFGAPQAILISVSVTPVVSPAPAVALVVTLTVAPGVVLPSSSSSSPHATMSNMPAASTTTKSKGHRFSSVCILLRGINFGVTETPFESIWERFNGKTALIPHLGLNNEVHFDDNEAYLEHVLRTRSHNRGLCVVVASAEGEVKASQPDSFQTFLHRARQTLAQFT